MAVDRAAVTGEAVLDLSLDGGGETRPAWYRLLAHLTRNRKAVIGLAILVTVGAAALLAPVLKPGSPTAFVDSPTLPPSLKHLLGTTGNGQDVLQQLLWGGRISLSVAFTVGALTTSLSAIIGMGAAYLGGRGDAILTMLMNVFLLIPGLPLIVTLAIFLPPGAITIVLVLSFTGWAWPARVMRAQALSLRERDFVLAAVVTGERGWRVVLQEMLPNMWSIVVASFMGSTVYAIGAEASLEFLGLGNAHQVTWGTMLYWAENHADLEQGAWWTFVPPGLAIALVAFALTMCNYAMDEITNPRLRAVRDSMKRARRARWWPGASRTARAPR